MKGIWLGVLLLGAAMGSARADNGSTHAEHAAARSQLQSFVDSFRASISSKNGAKLASMFLPETRFVSVYDDETFRSLKAKRPSASKVLVTDSKKFTDFVSTSPKPLEERFTNIRIDTDGTVATVQFNYGFYNGGALTNDGVETWQLVNSESGWKISAMLFSVRLVPGLMH
jgi:hypothetical protein